MHAPAPVRPRLAVLIDADNISGGQWCAIRSATHRFGTLDTLRCFGDFTRNRHSAWSEICREEGFQPVMVLSRDGAKNGADIAMAIDAMDLLAAAVVDGFVIVSSDSDFSVLADRIIRAGRVCVGIGCRTAPSSLRRAYTQFVELTEPVATATHHPQVLTDIEKLDAFAASLCRSGSDGSIAVSQLGSVLRQADPALAERFGRGRLLKSLRASGVWREIGTGSGVRIAPRLNKPT